MRTLPDPGFAGDDGSAPAEVTQALTAYAEDPDALHVRTLAVLQHSRLLVPVVAVLGEVEYDDAGLAHDKTSDMATVLMQGRDGRMALLAFTSTESLRRWNPEGRPVPVSVPDAARAARHDQASAIVVDVAGPVMFVIDSGDLQSLADGFTLTDLAGRVGWVRPDGDPQG